MKTPPKLRGQKLTLVYNLRSDRSFTTLIRFVRPRPARGFGLPKPVTILVSYLLLNIKKIIKVPKIFYAK